MYHEYIMNNSWSFSVNKTNAFNSSFDIEFLKQEIGQRIPFYDMKVSTNTVLFFVTIDESKVNMLFDQIRRSLATKGYIPYLRHERGEHIIYVMKKPKRKEKSIWINISLLIAVIITTTITGSLLNIGVSDLQSLSNITDVLLPENILNGILFFSLPLMSILFVHEMGHYFISKKHGINTSLPFFIPIPPILPGFNIGTFGALKSSNDPMPDKKALFDVGISGPIAGFLVALPVTIIGLITSTNYLPLSSITEGEIVLGSSILFSVLSQIFLSVPPGFYIDLNPIAFAGWIGMLITSINLLPAGQLDGGHMFRAMFGEKQKYASWIAIFIMIFTGWLFFALIILFVIGTSHPPPLNDDGSLDLKRKLLFIVGVLILIICFIPDPIMFFEMAG